MIRMTTPLIAPPIMAIVDIVLVLVVVAIVSKKMMKNNVTNIVVYSFLSLATISKICKSLLYYIII